MRVFVAGCFVLAFLAPAAARAGSIFVFTTDTSSLSGSTGYIDLSFSFFLGAESAIATITGFATNGTLGGCSSGCLTGDASGNLASTVTIANGAPSGSINDDYDEPITFGTYVQFLVDLSGAALSTPGGTSTSTFALTYYDGSYNPLLSTDPSGASAKITVEPNGTVLIQTYQAAGGSYDTTLGSVPEPASALTFLAGLALLAGCAVQARFRCRALSQVDRD